MRAAFNCVAQLESATSLVKAKNILEKLHIGAETLGLRRTVQNQIKGVRSRGTVRHRAAALKIEIIASALESWMPKSLQEEDKCMHR
jgi:hypothetical protein